MSSTFPVVAAGQTSTIADRSQGAERVVVATVRTVTPSWVQNGFGDRLIVSRLQLDVEEALKGDAPAAVWLDVQGGSLDGVTLRVSSLPVVRTGERGVFFLEPTDGPAYRPYLRGQGILLLDEHDVVRGSSMRLDEVRSAVRGRR